MKLLAVDTSSDFLGLAVLEDDTVKASIVKKADKMHASVLVPMIGEILDMSGFSFGSLDGFVVDVGPGSFTGLRIGVSTVKGFLCAAKKGIDPDFVTGRGTKSARRVDRLNPRSRAAQVGFNPTRIDPDEFEEFLRTSPGQSFQIDQGHPHTFKDGSSAKFGIKQVRSLDVITANIGCSNLDICAILDAKKGNFYFCNFRYVRGCLMPVSEYLLLGQDEIIRRIKRPTVFLGDGLLIIKGPLKKRLGSLAIFADKKFWYPDPGHLGLLGYAKIKKEGFDDAGKFLPFYIYPKECTITLANDKFCY